MSLPRQTFAGRICQLDFSMETPIGFFYPDLPSEEPNFDNPSYCAPLMLTSSAVALALITVAARPAYEDGSVHQWLIYLCAQNGITLHDVRPGRIGGLLRWHPAILARGTQVQDGIELEMRFVAFEDGQRFVTANAMCPRELAESYLPTLQHCIESIELQYPMGPTVPIEFEKPVPSLEEIQHDSNLPPPRDAGEVFQRAQEKKRTHAAVDAKSLVRAGKYDEAEAMIRKADDSIMGNVAIANLYVEALQEVRAKGNASDKALAETLYRRALNWRLNCYPDAHTEVEAENYERGQKQDRAELVQILGYDPDAKVSKA